MMNEKEFKESINYLKQILEENFVDRITQLIENKSQEKEKEETGAGKKNLRHEISDTLKNELKPYSRDNFYRHIKDVVDYKRQITVNNNTERLNEITEIINRSTEKMEGILVSSTYLGIIHGYTRQNIHVLIQKGDYENYLVGQIKAFKLMDII